MARFQSVRRMWKMSRNISPIRKRTIERNPFRMSSDVYAKDMASRHVGMSVMFGSNGGMALWNPVGVRAMVALKPRVPRKQAPWALVYNAFGVIDYRHQ